MNFEILLVFRGALLFNVVIASLLVFVDKRDFNLEEWENEKVSILGSLGMSEMKGFKS